MRGEDPIVDEEKLDTNKVLSASPSPFRNFPSKEALHLHARVRLSSATPQDVQHISRRACRPGTY